MDKHQIFETVARHLFKQGHKAVERKGGMSQCRYRAAGGRDKCAFGVLIPDEKYDPAMEGKPACEVINRYLPEFKRQEYLINTLQMVHDCHPTKTFNRNKLKDALKDVAKRFRIPAKVLDELHP